MSTDSYPLTTNACHRGDIITLDKDELAPWVVMEGRVAIEGEPYKGYLAGWMVICRQLNPDHTFNKQAKGRVFYQSGDLLSGMEYRPNVQVIGHMDLRTVGR